MFEFARPSLALRTDSYAKSPTGIKRWEVGKLEIVGQFCGGESAGLEEKNEVVGSGSQ